MARKQFPPKVRLILNILFAVVVIGSIALGWNREVDDPDAWFPNEVKKAEQTQEAPAPLNEHVKK